jgi:hypothetical protein
MFIVLGHPSRQRASVEMDVRSMHAIFRVLACITAGP